MPLQQQPDARQALRKALGQQRRALSRREQRKASNMVTLKVRPTNIFKQAKRVGLYLNAYGEVPTYALMKLCFKLKKQVYLPVIHPLNKKLYWQRISLNELQPYRFAKHILGMYQPKKNRGIPVNKLDLLIMPLLAVNPQGYRLGMGGGFYDRTLMHTTKNKPFRLGLAHSFQYTPVFTDVKQWDQPLNALLTPTQLIYF